MDEPFHAGLEDVFSVLPAPIAEEARIDTLRRLDGRTDAPIESVWGEFQADGTLVRGAVTQWPGGTRFFKPGEATPLLDELGRAAVDARPGEVRALADGRVFFWFSPTSATAGRTANGAAFKGFAVNQPLFAKLIHRLEPDVGLTKAETRAFFHVASGLSPAEAASIDGVSIETRRTQLRNLYDKLDCRGLGDLVRRASGFLAYLITLCDDDTRDAAGLEDFCTAHLDVDTRLCLQRMPSGRALRFLELGPLDGRVVLVSHGMLFPTLLIGAGRHLAAAGLRLIVPIRPGYFGDPGVVAGRGDANLTDAWIEDVATFAAAVLPKPLTLLATSNGSAVALRLARTRPGVVDRLVILSMNAGGLHDPARRFSHRFFSGLQRLALKPGVFGLLTWTFNRYYSDLRTVKPVLRGLFGDNAHDWQLLEGTPDRAPAYGWFSDGYRASTMGIAEDFRVVMADWRADLAAMTITPHFIHGLGDPLVPFSQVERLAKQIGAPLTGVDGGHFISATSPEKIWELISLIVHAKTDQI